MRAVIYERISDDRAGTGLGVARQDRDCRERCAREGWAVADVLVDNDRSAYSGRKRPGYQRLLEGLKENLDKRIPGREGGDMPSNPVIQIGSRADAEPDPDKKLRIIWGERIAEQLVVLEMTPKKFCRLLEDEGGIEVSLQTVYAWLNGSWAPTPTKQAAIAKVLRAPSNRLFPLEAA